MLIGLMPFAAFAGGENSVIETVNLTDFVIPSVGDQAVNNPSCTIESGKGYTYSSSMFFYKNNQFTRTFQGAETYTVRFHLARILKLSLNWTRKQVKLILLIWISSAPIPCFIV